MADADVVITGTVLTVDDARPTAEALAVADGRIVAVGTGPTSRRSSAPDTQIVDLGDGCVMPGFIEAHGHPLMEAIALSDRIVDIRPVAITRADDVVAAIRHEVAQRGPRCLPQRLGRTAAGRAAGADAGLARRVAPDGPLVIIHNSGHKAFFNSRAAQLNGLTRDTPDPKGAKYGRDADGELDGTAEEIGAVFPLLGGAIEPDRLPGDAARRVRPAQPGRADHLFGDGVRPEFPAGGRAAARRADGAAAHLRGVQPADVHHRHARPG